MNDINIYLCRHGESEANAKSQDHIIGQDNDSKLTEKGKSQAFFLGKRLLKQKIDFDFIWSSVYDRAKETAEIVCETIGYKKELLLSSAIVEYNPGDWKGKNRSIIHDNFKNMKDIMYLNMDFRFPNGESYRELERRSSIFMDKEIIYNKNILELAEKKEVNIVLFSHGQTIKSLLFRIMGYDQSFLWKIKIYNTSISQVIFNDKGFFLQSINDCGHLL